jgi:signal transduction histidine kinase
MPPAKPTLAQFRKLQARYDKLKVLYRISDLLHSTTNPKVLLRRILREAVREMKATSGSIRFVDEEQQMLETAVSYGLEESRARESRLRVGQGVTGFVAKTGEALRVDDVRLSPHYVELKREVRSELAVPLVIEGDVIGVLNVDSNRIYAFSQDDERLLMALGAQASRVIQTSRLYESLNEQTRKLEGLFAAGQALISPEPLPEILQRITRTVLELMDIKLCSLMLLNDKRELVLSAVSGGSENYTQRPNLTVTGSLVGQVVTRRQPMQVFDVRKAVRYRSAKMARKERLASLLSVPILFQEQLIGILNIYTARPRRFAEEEMTLLSGFASLCGIAIENAQRYERVLRAEQSIRQTDRLATLGILSAEIAHEIRNPTTIISMLLHSLQEDHAVAAGREKDLEIIVDKIERINRIVSQVLTFSKGREMPLEWVDLNSAVEDLLFLVNHNISARQVVVKKQYDAQLPHVLGDRGHFDQVLLNLILNALEAMPNGGVLTIRTGMADAGNGSTDAGAVQVVIRDTGVGISPDVLPQLFSPFVSTRKEGIGLGLFVSQKLMAQHGGSIDVKSAPGKGTTFTVQVPVEAK